MFQTKWLIVILLLFVQNNQSPEILWSETVKLTWSDFEGKPDANSPAAAITAAGISYNYSISKTNQNVTGFTAHVMTHFYPEYSWYKKEQVSPQILKHEQLHFNITELHSRLLRKALSTLKPSQDVELKIKALYKKANSDLEKMQRDYDNETDYSRDFEQQEAWEKKVNLHIDLLESYKL